MRRATVAAVTLAAVAPAPGTASAAAVRVTRVRCLVHCVNAARDVVEPRVKLELGGVHPQLVAALHAQGMRCGWSYVYGTHPAGEVARFRPARRRLWGAGPELVGLAGDVAAGDPVAWLHTGTAAALSTFQSRRGVPASGETDPATWKRLLRETPAPVGPGADR